MMKYSARKLTALFSALLCICMIISTSPITSFAYGEAPSDNAEAILETASETFSGRWSYKKLLRTVTTDYTDANEFFSAMATATKGTFFLYSDCTLPSNVTVPADVTFLLPYDSNDESGHGKGTTSTAVNRESWTQESTYLYHTLTVPEGKTLTVNGTLTVGGVYGYPDQSSQAHTSGAYSQIICSGTVKVNGSINVYGLVKGSGTLSIMSSGKLSLPFLVNDFDGGTNSKTLYDAGIFPFNEVTVNNVQSRCVMNYGCTVTGKARVYFHTLDTFTDTDVTLISSSSGIIQMLAGSTVTTTYDPNKKISATIGGTNLTDFGKLSVTVSGNAKAGSTSLKYTIYTFDSADYIFGLPYTMDLIIDSGTFTVPYQYRIMPGSSVTVNQGATLSLDGELQITDGWEQLPMSNKRYPTSAQMKSNGFSQSGSLIVNGTFNINSGSKFAGIIQTTQPDNAVVNINSSASLGGTFSTGTENSTVSYSLAPRLSLEGTLTDLTAGTSYYGYSTDTWNLPSYTMNVNGTSQTIAINQSMNGEFSLHKYIITNVSEPTCTQDGNTGDLYCTVCNQIIKAGTVIPATGHTCTLINAAEATCTQDGYTGDSYCSKCNQIVESGTVIPAAGHTCGEASFTWARTSVEEGWNVSAQKTCSVCHETLTAVSVTTEKNSDTVYTATAVFEDGTENIGTHTVPVLVPADGSDTVVDADRHFVYGLNAGLQTIEGKAEASESECTVVCENEAARIGSGTVIRIYKDGVLENEYQAVIFGDINGDGWYDGTDSVLAACINEGILTENQIGAAAYLASDCNHDGETNETDAEILSNAGILLSGIDQSASEPELVTSSAYCEYISVIDQNPVPSDKETETENAGFFVQLIKRIAVFIKLFFAVICF